MVRAGRRHAISVVSYGAAVALDRTVSRRTRARGDAAFPGEPDHFYFGAVDGGVWESLDAGRTWNPIFDRQDIGSIGAIAVAPSDPRTIYVGTGEADMRSDIAYGNGMYKSTDGGKTWAHVGLTTRAKSARSSSTRTIANVVYVAALGHPYASERRARCLQNDRRR